jgi:20S proteasome alpha/beta subunit
MKFGQGASGDRASFSWSHVLMLTPSESGGGMRRCTGFSLFVLVLQSASFIRPACVQGQETNSQSFLRREITSTQLESAYIHGTIDVVISTREGYVLASDSRGTYVSLNGTLSHSDDQQKAFPVGKNAACVIAGIIGSDVSMEGFRVRDALGSHLLLLDQRASAENQPVSASFVAGTFSHGLERVAGLMLPTTQPLSPLVGAVSTVSILPDGQSEWITFYLPLARQSGGTSNQEIYTVGQPTYLRDSQIIGMRFGIEALGFPFIVQRLVGANSPSEGPASSDVMKIFYERKQKGHLDEYTLADAIDLAKALVSATVASAPSEAGVGGPIDILVLTKDGVRWVQRKEQNAPFPALGPLVVGSTFGGGKIPLDGLQCVRCVFSGIDFSYAGNSDVELLSPEISGRCNLNILAGARRKQPTVVDRLERALANKCEVHEVVEPTTPALR